MPVRWVESRPSNLSWSVRPGHHAVQRGRGRTGHLARRQGPCCQRGGRAAQLRPPSSPAHAHAAASPHWSNQRLTTRLSKILFMLISPCLFSELQMSQGLLKSQKRPQTSVSKGIYCPLHGAGGRRCLCFGRVTFACGSPAGGRWSEQTPRRTDFPQSTRNSCAVFLGFGYFKCVGGKVCGPCHVQRFHLLEPIVFRVYRHLSDVIPCGRVGKAPPTAPGV